MSYATPKIPVSDDLKIGLFVRSDRAGVRIYARVVLPADVDPETQAPSYVLVRGTAFDQVDRWQKLELVEMMPAIERQARVLRVSTRRPVKLDGAYLERVVVNLLGGPGESQVFLDDLEIEPVPKSCWRTRPKTRDRAEKTAGPSARPPAAGSEATGRRLKRRSASNETCSRSEDPTAFIIPGFPPRSMHPGPNRLSLRDLGFDVLIDSMKTDPEKLRPAVAARRAHHGAAERRHRRRRPAADARRDELLPLARLGRLLASGQPSGKDRPDRAARGRAGQCSRGDRGRAQPGRPGLAPDARRRSTAISASSPAPLRAST